MFARWFSLSADLSASFVWHDTFDAVSTERRGTKTGAVLCFIPQARLIFLNRPSVRLYGKFGLGAAAYLGFDRRVEDWIDDDVQPLITRVGDNAWTSSYSVPGLEFTLNVRRLPSESRLGEQWIFSALELEYAEGGGYTFTLRTEGDVTYSWVADERQLSLEYDLVPSGVFMGQFCLDGQLIDWCRYSYDKGSSSSASGIDSW